MEKIIKKWSDSFVILLDKEDMKIYELEEDDIIDITIIKNNGTKRRHKKK